MSKLLFLAASALTILFTTSLSASEPILGEWTDSKKDGQISIYEKDGKYYGKLIWIKDKKRINDTNNPDETLREVPLIGLVILKGFTKAEEEGEYEGGTVYDSRSGKTYKGKMWIDDDGNLSLRGFVGISLIGRTDTWTRVEVLEETP